MITADGGGSNGVRNRLGNLALQGLADDLGLALHVCHFPLGDHSNTFTMVFAMR